MRLRHVLALIGFAIASTAWATEAFQIRPGRWEVVLHLGTGDREVPAGVPVDEPIRKIDCISKEDLEKFDGFMPPPEESCKVSDYRATGREISYLMKCGDMTMDFRATAHSPDAFSAVSTSHGKDQKQQLVMKMSGRRVGDACTAEEEAESREDD